MWQGIDAYAMSAPVDILKDLARFDEEVAKTEKWALRKAVLTRLKTLAKVLHCNHSKDATHSAHSHPGTARIVMCSNVLPGFRGCGMD